jgi:DNA repair photolyase
MDDTPPSKPPTRLKGRGAASNPANRYAHTRQTVDDDGWYHDDGEAPPHPPTTVTAERARTIITRNDSPDIGFEQSINMYRGCEHGCVYCYARPSHAYLDLSPGLDFETRLYAKTNAVELLRAELARPGYVCAPIQLGANTDPYQPIERRLKLTRGILEVLLETRHPVTITTKGGALIERDLALLQPLAQQRLVHVYVSLTTLDNRLASRLEPRASAPHRRLQAIRTLRDAGVPTSVLAAPLIPLINERELEAILEAARDAGAVSAGYVLIRLPHELEELFREWLAIHFPERAGHVMSLIQQMRGGRDNDPRFGHRMRGTGAFAQLIQRRFQVARERLGFARRADVALDSTRFAAPRAPSPQGELF